MFASQVGRNRVSALTTVSKACVLEVVSQCNLPCIGTAAHLFVCGLFKALCYGGVRSFATHHVIVGSELQVAKQGNTRTKVEAEV